jgi:hypothetical protein
MANYTVRQFNRCWVEINVEPSDEQTFDNDLTDVQVQQVNSWVQEKDLGKWMSFNQWKLKTPSAVTAFIMFWHGRIV